jgi:hypothetical protein
MVLTRSGRDVQRRLSRSAGRSSGEAAHEASPQLGKKEKSAPSTKEKIEVQKDKVQILLLQLARIQEG